MGQAFLVLQFSCLGCEGVSRREETGDSDGGGWCLSSELTLPDLGPGLCNIIIVTDISKFKEFR